MRTIFLCGLFSVLLLANEANSNIKEKIPYKIAQQEAKHAVHQFHKLIGGGLKKAIKKDGIIGGARFCAIKSLGVIKKLDKDLGENISIKRISLRNRNPKSTPTKDEKSILIALSLLEKSSTYLPKQITQVVDDGVYKIYSPATMSKKVCKKCHGFKGNINPKVSKLFLEKYPDDQAYGFKAGEVRGAVVVTVKVK